LKRFDSDLARGATPGEDDMRRSALPSFLALALFLAAAGCSEVSQAPPGTLAEAKIQAAERGVPVLLDFFTEW